MLDNVHIFILNLLFIETLNLLQYVQYLDHYLTRVDGIRRRICGLPDGAIKQSYLDCLRDIFNVLDLCKSCILVMDKLLILTLSEISLPLQQADQFLSSYFPGFVDRTLRLHSYWAWLEISLAKNVAGARGVFENLIKSRFYLY